MSTTFFKPQEYVFVCFPLIKTLESKTIVYLNDEQILFFRLNDYTSTLIFQRKKTKEILEEIFCVVNHSKEITSCKEFLICGIKKNDGNGFNKLRFIESIFYLMNRNRYNSFYEI